MTLTRFLIVALIGALSVSAASDAATPTFQGLGDLSGGIFYSQAHGVSADGSTVVGFSDSASGTQAFRWTVGGGMVGIGDLAGGSFWGQAHAVSADGSVVVGWSNSDSGTEAFRWTGTDLGSDPDAGLGDLPGGLSHSYAWSISADGSVVVGSGMNSDNKTEAFRWTQTGGMAGLGDLPGGDFRSDAYDVSADGSVVVGWSTSDLGASEPFRWTGTDLGSDPDAPLGDLSGGGVGGGNAYGVSSDGEVVVGVSKSGFGLEAFRWTGTDLDIDDDASLGFLASGPGAYFSHARGTSADGSVVVGYSILVTGGYAAFIWDEANGMRSLKDVLEDECGLDLTGWALEKAYDVSDDGLTIVGYGTNPDEETEAWVATIPEPAALSLLALGAAAMLKRRRIQKID